MFFCKMQSSMFYTMNHCSSTDACLMGALDCNAARGISSYTIPYGSPGIISENAVIQHRPSASSSICFVHREEPHPESNERFPTYENGCPNHLRHAGQKPDLFEVMSPQFIPSRPPSPSSGRLRIWLVL